MKFLTASSLRTPTLRSAALSLGVSLFCLLLSAPAIADRVITDDGRVIQPKKARPKDGGYLLEFEMGEIFVADPSRLKAVEIEGDMAEYVPQNEDEKTKLAQGFVRFQGKWLSKPFSTSRKATNKSAAEGRKGRSKMPL